MLRCESLLGLDQATCSRVLNKNYKLLVSMAPLSNEIRPISSCTPQVWQLEWGRAEEESVWHVVMLYLLDLCFSDLIDSLCFCLFGLALCSHLCARSDLWLCACFVGAQPAVAPQRHDCTTRERDREEARLMSNSPAWPQSSFLAELRETEGNKLNSCCATHAAVYSHTAGTHRSGIFLFFCLLLASLIAASISASTTTKAQLECNSVECKPLPRSNIPL